MGTIEDKLKYLAKTKVDLMNALKAKGAPIDESTPLSEYDVMVKAIKGGGAGTEVFNSIKEMKAATVSPGTVCKVVKEGIIKQPLTEATSIKSILLNNVIEMAKSSTNSTETRWESADGLEYFAIYKASGITGALYPNRKMIRYYSAVTNEGFEIYYDHDGEAYTTSYLNAPYLIEFSKPLTLVTSINHPDISALIYSTNPAEVLMHIFEYKDDEYKELIGTPKPYESIEDMEADAIAPEITAVVYDKSSNTFMGLYESTETGWRLLSGQLTTTANTIAPGFVGYGPDGIVNGTFTSDATAMDSDILEGQTAYVNGKKVIGSIQSTYITTDGVASPLYENSWTGNTSYRTMAFSHKFGVALLRTTTTQKTESLRIAKVNKETGLYSIASSSYDITNSALIGATGYSFVGADIAQQLNEDGTLRMAFTLSTLSTDVYSRDGYIVACDYDLNTYTIKKIYKPSFGKVDLNYFERDINASPVYFSPVNKDVFLVLDCVATHPSSSSNKYTIPGWLEDYKCPLCFIQDNGDILLRSCLDNASGTSVCTQRIAWSPSGSKIWYNGTTLYACTDSSASYNEGYMATVDYGSTSVTTVSYAKAAYGHMVFLNENTLFELKYNKAYNIYSTNGTSLTKIKSGTIDMNIYYKTGSNTKYETVSELRCVDNNIFYVDAQNFYCITLDDEYNVSKVQALDSKYCCLEFPQETSPFLNRKCLVAKVEDGKYIHCSDVNQYYAVFQVTGDKVIETINKDGTVLHNTSSATANASNILINKSAYINGGKVSGSMPNNGGLTYDPGDEAMTIPLGYTSGGTVKATNITKLQVYNNCDDIADAILAMPKILPEEYESLDYIESTGKQYIPLSDWFSSSLTTEDYFDIIADIQFIDVPKYPFTNVNTYNISGIRGSSNVLSSTGTYFYFGYTTSGVTDEGAPPVLCYSPGLKTTDYKTTIPADSKRHIYKVISDPSKSDVGFWVDDQQLDNRGSTLASRAFQRPFYICGYKASGGTMYGVKQRVFRFQLLNNDGSLFYDLIPARRKSDNAIGLYDLIKGTFYTNSGSGSFLYKLTDTRLQPKLNVYTQELEPYSKNGIWFAKECSLTNIIADRKVLNTGDWDTEKMNSIKKIPYSFYGRQCVAIGTDIYMFGSHYSSYYTRATKYDTLTDTYTTLTNVPYDFYAGSVAAIGTDIYLFGGSGNNFRAYKYNTLTDTYTRLTDIPDYYYGGAIAVYDTKIYLIGSVASYRRQNVIVYETTTDTYTSDVSLPAETQYGCAAIVGSYIYVFNGTKIYRKTITGTSWSTLSLTVTTSCSYGNCIAVGTDIYIFGSQTSDYRKNAYKYDTSAGTITKITSPTYALEYPGLAFNGQSIYVMGSYDAQTRVQILTMVPKEYPNGSLVISQDSSLNKATNLIDVDIPNLVTYYDRVYYKDGNGNFALASPLYNGDGTKWTKVQ